MSDALYQEIILDHFKHPRSEGLREPYDAEVHQVNPTCGDEVTLRLRVREGVLEDVSFSSEGCAISKASTSVMYELVAGASIEDAKRRFEAFRSLMRSKGQGEPDEELLGDAAAFAGVARYPARVRCALLGWSAWEAALREAAVRGGA